MRDSSGWITLEIWFPSVKNPRHSQVCSWILEKDLRISGAQVHSIVTKC